MSLKSSLKTQSFFSYNVKRKIGKETRSLLAHLEQEIKLRERQTPLQLHVVH